MIVYQYNCFHHLIVVIILQATYILLKVVFIEGGIQLLASYHIGCLFVYIFIDIHSKKRDHA